MDTPSMTCRMTVVDYLPPDDEGDMLMLVGSDVEYATKPGEKPAVFTRGQRVRVTVVAVEEGNEHEPGDERAG